MASLVTAEKEWSQIGRRIVKLKVQIGELEQSETLRGLTSAFENLNTQLSIVREFEIRSASRTWAKATDGELLDAFLLEVEAVKEELEDEAHRINTAVIAKGPAVTTQPKVEDSGFQSRCRLPALELATFDGEMKEMESSDSQYLDSPQRQRGKGKGEDAATLSSPYGGRSSGEPPRKDTPSRGIGGYKNR